MVHILCVVLVILDVWLLKMMMTDYLKLPNRKKKNIHFVEKLVIDDDYILSHSHVTNYSGTT